MKQQIASSKNVYLLLTIILLLGLNLVNSDNLKSKDKITEQQERANVYYEHPVMRRPDPHFHQNEEYHHNEEYHQNNEYILPRVQGHHRIFNNDIHHIEGHIHAMNHLHQEVFRQERCPCIDQVKCPPCGLVYEPSIICPCAPKLNCQICPPLSLIHEIAANKAKQDQILSNNLKGLSTQISSLLNNITKYASDVAKFEIEAKNAARQMEEASLKAQFAKKKMFETSEKARYIAKSTLYPCIDCPNSEVKPMWYGVYNRIFPEEVSNVDKYSSSNSNINYKLNSNSNISQADEIAKLSEGKINVLPLRVNSKTINLSKKRKKIQL